MLQQLGFVSNTCDLSLFVCRKQLQVVVTELASVPNRKSNTVNKSRYRIP